MTVCMSRQLIEQIKLITEIIIHTGLSRNLFAHIAKIQKTFVKGFDSFLSKSESREV